MASTPRTRFRRQVRNFTLIWVGITFIMGAVTFVAIYMAYGSLTRYRQQRQPAQRRHPDRDDRSRGGYRADQHSRSRPYRRRQRLRCSVAQAETATLAPTATLLPVENKRFQLGVQVQISYDHMDQWTDVAANQLGVKWVKQQVRWEDIEKEKGTYDWYETDTFLTAAAAQGLKVLVSVVTAPDWAREQGADLTQHGPPANPQDYADFVAALLRRYPGKIHAVEVWNEQNLDREWTSTNGLSAANYVALLHATYQTVKAIDPGVIVVSGALSPTGLSDGVHAWDDFVYMDQMIDGGLAQLHRLRRRASQRHQRQPGLHLRRHPQRSDGALPRSLRQPAS